MTIEQLERQIKELKSELEVQSYFIIGVYGVIGLLFGNAVIKYFGL